MERRMTVIMAFALLGLLLLAEAALAVPTSPTTFNRDSSSRRSETGANQQLNALAGNVTQVTVEAVSITKSWQGYYGNVSGRITLDDANNNTFYNWSLATTDGEIYASRETSPTWASAACADNAQIAAEETALGQSATDNDAVSVTFTNTTNHPAFDVGTVSITANDCSAANMFDNNGAQTSEFFNVLLYEGSHIVYTALMQGGATGFNGQTWDFELLVGEDGHGDSSVTPYYFFVELG